MPKPAVAAYPGGAPQAAAPKPGPTNPAAPVAPAAPAEDAKQLEALLAARGEKGLLIARKHLGWTCQGFAGAAELRHGLMRAGTPEATRELLARAADGFGSSRP